MSSSEPEGRMPCVMARKRVNAHWESLKLDHCLGNGRMVDPARVSSREDCVRDFEGPYRGYDRTLVGYAFQQALVLS